MRVETEVKYDFLIDYLVNESCRGLKVDKELIKDKAMKANPLEEEKVYDTLIKTALENIDEANGDYTYFASRVYLKNLYKHAANNRGYVLKEHASPYGDFNELIATLTQEGIYNPVLEQKYGKAEIKELGHEINPYQDLLFDYLGIYTLSTRYLATDHDKNVYELPQERWMIIAMHLMQDEDPSKRLELVKEAYWALSNLYMTVATPTLANAGKTHGQLSSCFIDTVDDDLHSIYDSNSDIAQISKNGGGLGVYMGRVRSRGSSIKGFKGMSSGVVPWIKQLNNTAVSVDQLGARKGAIAIYLDIWHKDIEYFLDLKLNNGDDRMRAHDIFTGVCLPDYFMEQVEQRGEWHLFDPHEVRQV
ncbi:ribonucleotide reductase N-terminal alpha domain-containing protein, partial [Oceanobacillus profundus]